MSERFVNVDRDTPMLLPVDLREWVAADDMVHFVLGNHEMMVLRGDLRYVHEKYNLVAKKFKIKISDLYGPETELGRWLRSKNVMIRINDILFVHGGVSMALSETGYSMQRINKMVRDGIDLRDYEIRFNEDLQLLFGSN